MRTLLVTLLLLTAPAAFAGHAATYSPDWGRRPPPAWDQRGLAGPAQALDQSATRLYYDLRSQTGRSELTSRARALAQASRDFRRLAEQGAPYAQLQDAYQHAANRYASLERRLDNRGRSYRHPYAAAGLEQVNWALWQAGNALQRYAYDRRDYRRQDRYAYGPQFPDPRQPQWQRQRGLDAH